VVATENERLRRWVQEWVLLGFLVCLNACERTGEPVYFVVPNNYRGAFKLVVDEKDGIIMAAQDGRFTCVIPQSGVLKVKTNKPLLVWHRISASYADGTSIPLIGEGSVATNTVVFSSLQSVNNQTYWFFIGTEEEIRAAQKNPNLQIGGVNRK